MKVANGRRTARSIIPSQAVPPQRTFSNLPLAVLIVEHRKGWHDIAIKRCPECKKG